MNTPAPVPRTPSLWRRSLLGLLRLFGWKTVLVWPPEPKGIVIVYPHTSNWDFVIGMLFRVGYDLPANWIGKAEMFPKPFRGLLKWLGGIPVDRSRATGFIDAMVQEYRSRDWIWVGIAPEGTRSLTQRLKLGFYKLALAADVPVGFGYIDYGTRTVGIDTYVRFTGDEERDLDTMRQFYAAKRGLRPECTGPIRFGN
jgi:1-acyl-sn-glycerol-3-phosphate acyltransferase